MLTPAEEIELEELRFDREDDDGIEISSEDVARREQREARIRHLEEKGSSQMQEDQTPANDEVVDGSAEEEVVDAEEVVDPGPPPAQDFGKVVYIKNADEADLTEEQQELVRDADVVIEDRNIPIITKNREGVAGVPAAPELIEHAEVIE